MQLKHCWTPPLGTLPARTKWGEELVFPRVFGRAEQPGEDKGGRTHFALWFVHRETGADRIVEAPFFLEEAYRGHSTDWEERWAVLGVHEGSLVVSLSWQQSYDIAYAIYFYDGVSWSQAMPEEPNIRLYTLGQGHEILPITDAGPVRCVPLFEGGEVVFAPNPTRVAVDYTHAFAYDSGPESPKSPEYLSLCEENHRNSDALRVFQDCSDETVNEAVGLIPQEYLGHFDRRFWKNYMCRLDNYIWVIVYISNQHGFVQLIQLDA